MSDVPGSLSTRIAQLIFPRIGSNMYPAVTVEEDEERIAALVRSVDIGGLCLFNGRWPETSRTLQRLQELCPIPLLIVADMEQGAGLQVAGLTLFPHARAFDSLEGDATAYVARSARITAREARAAGIHAVLGPVADVDSDRRNPIIATRAFATSPARVADCVAAYVQAAQTSGLLCTAKHFPGHGHTVEDSHETLPSVGDDERTLGARELPPFEAAIRSDVALVMSAHVSYPALDPSGLPATLSNRILQQLLREKLGFRGAVISDSLMMSGVRERFDSETELAIAALRAGIDILTDIEDPLATVRGIAAAIEAGQLPRSRIDDAFERVWQLKARCCTAPMDSTGVSGTAEAEDLAREIARRACRPWGHWQPIPRPLPTCRSLALVYVASVPEDSFGARFLRQDALGQSLREQGCQVALTWKSWSKGMPIGELAGLSCDDHLILAMLVKPMAWHPFGLQPEQRQQVEQVIEACRARSIPYTIIALGASDVLDEFPSAERRLAACSDVPVSQLAAAGVLLQGTPV